MRLILTCAATLALLAACGTGSNAPAEDAPAADDQSDAVAEQPDTGAGGDASAYPGMPASGALETTSSGLQYVVLEEGDGPVPEAGQTVVVHYSGYFPDGEMFDSSVERGEPFSFVLGQGAVIRGWDEGVALMKVGETRKLVIPGDLAYGSQGRPGIPANATLVFDVELLEVQ